MTTTQICIIVAAIETCLLGVLLCKVVDVTQARMRRIKRIRQSMSMMQEHAALLYESAQLRSKKETDTAAESKN